MSHQKVRLIIAEDDYLVNEEIKRSLRGLKYEIVGEASNGEQAFEMTCALKPDATLMDIKMPKLDGIEASRLIQKECPTPVVILTAHESEELLDQATKIGVGAYLTKPPKPVEIDRAIRIAIARHHDLMKLRLLNQELENALKEIKVLRGILPICSNCKKIRTDDGYWQHVDQYIQKHSDLIFSHGICIECSDKLYGNEDWYKEGKNDGTFK